MTWDLGNNLNWDLVLRQTYYASNVSTDGGVYTPIPTIAISANSYTLLIGCRNTQAKPRWYLAGYANPRLLFTPSSTSEFMATVQAYPRVKLGLDRLNLVRFKDFNLLPYLLEISLPYWHKEMLLEIWSYSGTTDSLQPSLDRIESKVDVIQEQTAPTT